jgi:hypothetical protein
MGLLLALGFAAVLLPACAEDSDVEDGEDPGVYDGGDDYDGADDAYDTGAVEGDDKSFIPALPVPGEPGTGGEGEGEDGGPLNDNDPFTSPWDHWSQ